MLLLLERFQLNLLDPSGKILALLHVLDGSGDLLGLIGHSGLCDTCIFRNNCALCAIFAYLGLHHEFFILLSDRILQN